MKILEQAEIARRVRELDGWSITPQGIRKEYKLDDFLAAIQLVNQVAEIAEKANHHPDISINYNKVAFTIITHDAGGITNKDFDLAAQIEEVAELVVR